MKTTKVMEDKEIVDKMDAINLIINKTIIIFKITEKEMMNVIDMKDKKEIHNKTMMQIEETIAIEIEIGNMNMIKDSEIIISKIIDMNRITIIDWTKIKEIGEYSSTLTTTGEILINMTRNITIMSDKITKTIITTNKIVIRNLIIELKEGKTTVIILKTINHNNINVSTSSNTISAKIIMIIMKDVKTINKIHIEIKTAITANSKGKTAEIIILKREIQTEAIQSLKIISSQSETTIKHRIPDQAQNTILPKKTDQTNLAWNNKLKKTKKWIKEKFNLKPSLKSK
jgi:hypothetical protein